MPLIPIRTDFRPQRPPVANWVLIALNVLVFALTNVFGGQFGQQLVSYYALDGARPSLHQYLSYQFLHGDIWHLVGNMLFLWIFGGPVCDRMGGLGFVLFYLSGGVFAGLGFAATADNPMVGASGAIAAVTTAFLALFPRIHVTMLVWMLFVFTFQVPAMILIVFKIILWDNVLAPAIDQGAASNVAYSAHLAGYAFGFAVAMLLLAIRALPRNQFDLLGLWDRWGRRTGLRPAPGLRPLAARPITVEEIGSRPLEDIPLTPVEQLREEVAARLAARELSDAAGAYEELLRLDPEQVLPRPQQIELANWLAQTGKYAAAARAYEMYLTAYPGSPDAAQVMLFLGMLYSRYLADYARAAAHLRRALSGLDSPPQRGLAEEELRTVEGRLGD
jgi:membrane associated rhomboid family serine protease